MEVTLKRKSWHRWLAKFSGLLSDWEDETDICRYTKCVLLGLFKFICVCFIVGFLGSALLTLVVGAICGFYYFIFSGIPIKELLAAGGWVGVSAMSATLVLAGGLIAALIELPIRAIRALRNRKRWQSESPPGFVSSAFRSWKDKTCFKIKFTEE